jgi:hypothetical protein
LAGFKRRFGDFVEYIKGLYIEKGPSGYGAGSECTIEYEYHVDEEKYEPIIK